MSLYWFNQIDFAYVPTTREVVAYVDIEDLDLVSERSWQASFKRGKLSAITGWKTCDTGRRTSARMHREILGLYDPRIHVDHKDRNPANNQRKNLRICSNSQNKCNQGLSTSNSTGRKGVFWNKMSCKFEVKLQKEGRQYSAGLFDDLDEAARAYDQKAIELFGEFALTNADLDTYSVTPDMSKFRPRQPSLCSRNTSGRRGVRWHKASRKWQSRIKHKEREYHIGYFDDLDEAARAYDKKAVELYGDSAKTNESMGLILPID